MLAAVQDHEVREDQIVLVSLLMAELGVHSVAYAFPRVKIITTAVDQSLDDLLHVLPGIGECWRELAKAGWRRRRQVDGWVLFGLPPILIEVLDHAGLSGVTNSSG